MANTAGLDKRGPKLGDAASLWNFTPSPGWTKDEAAILRLCLMKYGIGRWVQILDTGLLPGKLIQQLNGQTQRLLGQQSLAAVTGLHVDLDRIREDNSKRADVERKGGLIIWSGPNPTAEMKSKWQKEAKAKYGLTKEQREQAEQELEEVAASLRPQEPLPLVSLMDANVGELSREQKLQLLARLRRKLQSLALSLSAHSTGAAEADQQDQEAAALSGVDQPTAGSSRLEATTAKQTKVLVGNNKASKKVRQESRAGNESGQTDTAKPRRQQKAAGKRARPATGKQKNAAGADDDCHEADDDQDAVVQLQAMGFPMAKAKAALEECDGDSQAAAEWLVANCT